MKGVAVAALRARRIASHKDRNGATLTAISHPATLLWHRLWFLLVLAPLPQIVSLLWLIWKRTTSVPSHDEWVTVGLVRRFDQGSLRWPDLWALHNEHRIVFPRLIDLILIEITHWNRQIEMTFNLALAVGTLVLFLACIRKTARSATIALACIIPVSLLLLSLGGYENWQAPFQIAFLLTVFGVALCTWAFVTQSGSWQGIILAVAGALIASFSSFAGLAVWIAFLPIIWTIGSHRRSFLLLWGAIGLATIILYLQGLRLDHHGDASPVGITRYVLTYLGAPVGTPDITRSQLVMLVSIVVLVVNVTILWVLGRHRNDIVIWISVALFAFACATITAGGRDALYGVTQALSSRYQVFSALWWTAGVAIAVITIAQVVDTLRASSFRRYRIPQCGVIGLNVVGLVLLSLSLMQVNLSGFRIGAVQLANEQHDQYCAINYTMTNNSCLNAFAPVRPAEVRQDMAYLEQHDYAIFHSAHRIRRETLTRLPAPASCPVNVCAIDAVGNIATTSTAHVTVPYGTALQISGWAMDAKTNERAAAILISIDGSTDFITDYGDSRPDVAKYFANSAYEKSGFHARIPTDGLSLGKHVLNLAIISPDEKSYYEPSQTFAFSVRPIGNVDRADGSPRFNVDAAFQNGMDPLTKKFAVVVSGWAVDSEAGKLAGGVYINIDDSLDIPADYGQKRLDVGTYLQNAAYAESGFFALIPSDLLPDGPHRFRLKILASDSTVYYEPSWTSEIKITRKESA